MTHHNVKPTFNASLVESPTTPEKFSSFVWMDCSMILQAFYRLGKDGAPATIWMQPLSYKTEAVAFGRLKCRAVDNR